MLTSIENPHLSNISSFTSLHVKDFFVFSANSAIISHSFLFSMSLHLILPWIIGDSLKILLSLIILLNSWLTYLINFSYISYWSTFFYLLIYFPFLFKRELLSLSSSFQYFTNWNINSCHVDCFFYFIMIITNLWRIIRQMIQ